VTQPVSERIALVAPSLEAAAVLRHDFIKWLTKRGHRVLCLTPPGPGRYIRILRGIGAQHRHLEPPPSLRILADWQMIKALVAQFSDWEPNIVLAVGVRTLTLSAVAARRAGVRRVVSVVNGLPSDGIESVGRRRFAEAIRASDAVVFHNRDNESTLARLGLLPRNAQTLIVPGSGIDLKQFPTVPLPPHENGLSFLMLSRLERRRGVLEYKAAAQKITAAWPGTTFRLAGQPSDAADAVAPETLTEGGAVEYLGHLEDVRPALAACHVFVYPSYGEGMPRAALEALATGRPVITTRAPGCADTVDEMVSGCMVEPADVASLATAMESYLRNPGLLATGARAARLKAERRFNAKQVNAALARLIGVA
jgi:glycosyltransferase involved in cell wall biosynthesis